MLCVKLSHSQGGVVTDLVEFLVFWVKQNPLIIAAAVVALVVITWLLNRKSAMEREADRVVKDLVDGAKDKYKDLRPLQ